MIDCSSRLPDQVNSSLSASSRKGQTRRRARAFTGGLAAALMVTGGALLASTPAHAAPYFSIVTDEGSTLGGLEITVIPPMEGDSFVSVSAGLNYSLGFGTDGKPYAWGSDNSGKLGDGAPHVNQPAPVEIMVPAGITFTELYAGVSVSFALASNGRVYSWGGDVSGLLGDGGSGEDRPYPAEVALPAGLTARSIASGGYHALVLASDGNIYSWGSNQYGQLGIGSWDRQFTPVRVDQPAGVTFVKVAVGRQFSLALDADGQAYSWGHDASGQLGDGGSNSSRLTPVLVQMPPGVTFTDIVAGGNHALALGSDGNTYAWGSNDF